MESGAQRIRLARRHAGLSQTQLAQKVGVRRSAVSHWESAEGKNPSMTNLRSVATVTQVQFEWLATGRGAMQVSAEQALDSVAAAEGMVIEDGAEMRLIGAFRALSANARVMLLELAGMLAMSHGRVRRSP
jgi:transcriptional regulator with XRE-family HTH domain